MGSNYRNLLPGSWRSSSLYNLSPEEIERIKGDGIKCIIDLRTSKEREEKPDTHIDGIEYLHMPVFSDAVLGITKETVIDPAQVIKTVKDKAVLRRMIPDMPTLYRNMIIEKQTRDNILGVVRLIRSNMENGIGTIFHCTAGKDRTGIISALLLCLEGKDMDYIMKDYLYTNRYTTREAITKYILVLIFKRDPVAARLVYRGYRAEKEFLKASFQAIKEVYGSIENFKREFTHPKMQ